MAKIDGMLQQVLSTRRPEPLAPKSTPRPAASPASMQADALSLSKALPKAQANLTDKAQANLTDEEKAFIASGLLPENYGEIKAIMEKQGVEAAKAAYRKGKAGPFDPVYGDPSHMLWLARKVQSDPEWRRLFQDLQLGDIIVETYNNPDDMVSVMTNGPFIHARICVSLNPPEFVEAVGITGNPNDATNHTVRRSPLPYSANMSVRLLRPTEGVPEPQKSRAIKEAVAFAEKQLGKPYDYSFTNINQGDGLTDAFYCSELAYLAYASPEGANFNIPISKSPERDQRIVVADALVTALDPENRQEVLDATLKLFARNPKPSGTELVAFLVDNVMTKCKATEKMTASEEDRKRLKETIQALMEGRAFPNLHRTIEEFNQDQANGKHDGFFGWAQQQKNYADIAIGFTQDLVNLVGTSGISFDEAVEAGGAVVSALLPHSEVLMTFLYGPNDFRTQAARTVLDTIDWLKQNVPDLPIVGNFGLDLLPERAKPQLKTDFVSPTDLAWSDLPARDYNVKPGFPIDQEGYEKAVLEKAGK